MTRSSALAGMTATLIAAAFLRLHRLAEIPPGLTHDEADVGHFALNVLNGVRETIASPQGYIHEPLAHYSGAAFRLVFGRNNGESFARLEPAPSFGGAVELLG